MRVLVIGPGGVGGYLAFRLKKCGVDVDVLGRKKIDEIIVKEKEEEKIKISNANGKYDIIFVTTKSYHLDEILKTLNQYIKEDTLIVPILNGIGHFEKFKDFNILKACIYILSNKENGIIHKKNDTFYLCIENNERIKKVFEGCNLKVKFSEEIEKDIWKKYLFISTFATLQSFYKNPTGWIMEHKKEEVEKFLDEVIKIAKENGIDLKDQKEKVIKQALNIPYNSKMSMQIDFENNQKTELENITGFLAKKSEFIKRYYDALRS